MGAMDVNCGGWIQVMHLWEDLESRGGLCGWLFLGVNLCLCCVFVFVCLMCVRMFVSLCLMCVCIFVRSIWVV